MIRTEVIKFTKKEIDDLMKIYKTSDQNEVITKWAYSQGYGNGGYYINIKNRTITITELP